MTVKNPFAINKHIPNFIDKKSGIRESFQCVKYTGEYGIAVNGFSLVVFPSKLPPMVQNYYTREPFDGDFPDVTKALAYEVKSSAAVSVDTAKDIIRACRSAIGFYGDNNVLNNDVKVSFSERHIHFHCFIESISTGSSVTAPLVTDRFSLHISPTRLFHAMNLFVDYCRHNEQITFGFTGELMPLIIYAGDIKCVISPMRGEK